MEKEFSRVRSAKDITITATLIITGCVLVALPTSASINITGFFLIFTGLILAFVLRTGYKDNETGEKYSKMDIEFLRDYLAPVASFIERNPDKILWCGEFGTIRHCNIKYRENWMRDMIKILRLRRMELLRQHEKGILNAILSMAYIRQLLMLIYFLSNLQIFQLYLHHYLFYLVDYLV